MEISFKLQIIRNEGIEITAISGKLESSENEILPVIIIPSGFGSTVKDNFLLSLFLINNGFEVIRYDGINSNCFNTWPNREYRLSKILRRLDLVYKHVEDTCKTDKISIIASDILARVAVKYFGKSKKNRNSVVSLLFPILEIDKLVEISNNSIFKYVGRVDTSDSDIFNHTEFIQDCQKNNFLTKTALNEELKDIYDNLVIFAQEEEYFEINHLSKLFDYKEDYKNLKLMRFVLRNTTRSFQVNKYLCAEITKLFMSYYYKDKEIRVPQFEYILYTNKKEKNSCRRQD